MNTTTLMEKLVEIERALQCSNYMRPAHSSWMRKTACCRSNAR
jgi:hypothetical protein